MALHRVSITEALVQELIKAIHEPITTERIWFLRNERVLGRGSIDRRYQNLEVAILTNVETILKTVLMTLEPPEESLGDDTYDTSDED